MRILYTNLFKDALTMTPSNQDAHFALSNALMTSLSIPYRTSNTTTPNITIEWSADVTVDCVGIAGHNLATLEMTLYDSSDNVLLVDNFTLDEGTNMLYFQKYTNIRKMYLDFTTNESYAEIGYMACGEYFQMPDPNWGYSENLEILNETEQTKFGNIFGTDGEILQVYEPTFRFVPFIQMSIIRAMVREVRNYKPIFVDMLEDAHDVKEPLYAILNLTSFAMSRDMRGHEYGTFSLNITEVM